MEEGNVPLMDRAGQKMLFTAGNTAESTNLNCTTLMQKIQTLELFPHTSLADTISDAAEHEKAYNIEDDAAIPEIFAELRAMRM